MNSRTEREREGALYGAQVGPQQADHACLPLWRCFAQLRCGRDWMRAQADEEAVELVVGQPVEQALEMLAASGADVVEDRIGRLRCDAPGRRAGRRVAAALDQAALAPSGRRCRSALATDTSRASARRFIEQGPAPPGS